MAEPNTRTKHIEAITKEIESLRGWLDYLQRDITNDKGVIHALILLSISESCTKLIYSAGIVNGVALKESE